MEVVGPGVDGFAGELEALKGRGCIVLLVGPGAGTIRCGDLLGDDDRDRTRLVVDTRHDLEGDPGEDPYVVHAGSSDVRSASASATPGEASLPETPGLDVIAGELVDRIDSLDAGELEPGELRMCLGDLGSLLSDRSGDPVAFVETVGGRIRESSGMGHAHLPDTSPLRATIEPLFDVTVEIRPVPEGRQQRWLLHEADLDSGWIAVED